MLDDVATRNISLTREQDAFIAKVVESGEYQNASEAVRDALRLLQQRREEDRLRLRALKAQLRAGVEALEAGDYLEVDPKRLDAVLDGIARPRGKRGR